ncbi:MAG: hypothetical protein QOE45_2477 [Frankiaceae bacterium]|jgi:DNA-binding CsgD family transcriptional regulator|nr:hypothetical protein [Frankiaceae bacterium]
MDLDRLAARLTADPTSASVADVGMLAVLARAGDRPEDGLAVVGALLPGAEGAVRAALFHARARLRSYGGDMAGRLNDLCEAREAAERCGDVRGTALALAELAFPIGETLPLRIRADYGRRAVRLARRCGDPLVLALAHANLALTELNLGDEAAGFRHWARAGAALPVPDSVVSADVVHRVAANWVEAAVTFGRYAEARAVIDRVRGWPDVDRLVRPDAAMLAWRTGAWDDALAELSGSATTRLPGPSTMAGLVRSAIEFERGSGALDPGARFTEVGADITSCVAIAVQVRIRARRREPWPARDAETSLGLVHATRQRVGWPEVWLAVVEVDPAAATEWAERLADLWPTGRRDTIVRRHGTALLLSRDDPESAYRDLLGVAADYRRLDEPWSEGWALRHAADAGAAARLPRGTLAEAVDGAAEIFRRLGADRSLAELLRAHGDRRALRSVPLPSSQRRRTSPGLTPREEEIAMMAARGLTAALIASRLDLSPGTVRKHLERIRAKLGIERKHELVELFRSRT